MSYTVKELIAVLSALDGDLQVWRTDRHGEPRPAYWYPKAEQVCLRLPKPTYGVILESRGEWRATNTPDPVKDAHVQTVVII